MAINAEAEFLFEAFCKPGAQPGACAAAQTAHQIDRDSAIDRFQLLPHPLDHKARNFPVFLDVLFESVGLDVAELAAFCHFL